MTKITMNDIAIRMAGQDEQCTANPIYIVEQRCRIYGIDTLYTDNTVYWYDGSEYTEEEKNQAIKDEEIDESELELVGYKDIYVFVQCFLSMIGAERYLKANKHSLTDPIVMVGSGYRNDEWKTVREHLIND